MMSKAQRSTADILRDAEQTMETAEFGYRLLANRNPALKLPGLRNVAVFGRAVTLVLQNLRSTEKKFDEWYGGYQKQMEKDELMRYFVTLRNNIEKRGKISTSVTIHNLTLRMPGDLLRLAPPPPGATGFFIGDQLGGSGWEVKRPDGSVEKYYVALPSEIASVTLHFPDPPVTHLGQRILDTSIENLCKLYLEYLRRVLDAAKTKFK
jgi:hypothetical protein